MTRILTLVLILAVAGWTMVNGWPVYREFKNGYVITDENNNYCYFQPYKTREPNKIESMTITEPIRNAERQITGWRQIFSSGDYYLAGELQQETYCGEAVPFFRVVCPNGREIVTRALALYSNDGTYQGDVLVLVPEKDKP